jgi:methylglyoxal synthase
MRIALIAHDRKKADMAAFCSVNRDFLSTCDLVATGTTGKLLTEITGLNIQKMLSGPFGGDLQIASMIASGLVDAVIFLRDPLTAQPHEPDITALLRICDVHNVPVATNQATGAMILAVLSKRQKETQ